MTYVPFDRERIERIRRTFVTFSGDTDLATLCDMAISSLLYAEEIQRLRDTPRLDLDDLWQRHRIHGPEGTQGRLYRDQFDDLMREVGVKHPTPSEIAPMPDPSERATQLRLVSLLESIIQVRGGMVAGFNTMNEKLDEMARLSADALLTLGDVSFPSATPCSDEVFRRGFIAAITAWSLECDDNSSALKGQWIEVARLAAHALPDNPSAKSMIDAAVTALKSEVK